MTARLYRSTDSGAPTLSGTAATGIPFFDAVLVNGYNSKTVTITRSGATATATCVGHGFASDGLTRVVISGAGQTEYNIETTISNVTANTFDYVVSGTPTTPATGTITAQVPGSGWSKAFTGTNLAAYKQAGGQQRLFRIDDSGNTALRVLAVESMADISTYQNPMPSEALISGGGYWYKSTAANTTARPWVMVATGQAFWLWIDIDSSSGTASSLYGYGDFVSHKTSDLYNQHLCCSTSGTAASNNAGGVLVAYTTGAMSTGAKTVQRPFSGYGQATAISWADWTSSTKMFGNFFQYPNPANSMLELNKVYVMEENAVRMARGYLPGIWSAQYSNTFASHGDTFSCNVGDLSGKTFMYLKQYNSSGVVLEISNTW